MPNIIEIIKKAAVEAVEAADPTAVVYGRVSGISPLLVTIDQRLTLSSEHLILTGMVSDFQVSMTTDGHTNTYKVDLGLKEGEKVILIKTQGGQQYIILDRVR